MLEKIENIVLTKPNNIAYIFNDDKITYQELWINALKYADYLKRQGVSPIIIYGNKDISVITAILACILAGRTYVPIGLCTPLFRLEKIVELTKSNLVITDLNINITNTDCLSINELEKYKDSDINIINNDIIYIIFTSGSTGIPKGVPISKSNLDNFINWLNNIYPLNEYKDIKVFNQASFSFDLSVADLYYALTNGHTLVATDIDMDNNYDDIFKFFKDIDVAVLTPTFIKLCLLNPDFNYTNYPNFKCVYFCGEQLEVKTVKKIYERFPNLNVINAYGPTEATSAVSAILINKDMLDGQLLPVGDINNLATDIIIDNDEIVLKGSSVFNGYLTDIAGGYYKENDINCYKTGDIGYINNNLLYCKGRIDNQIKYKGYRIELGDIEYSINLIDGVKECAVIAKYNADLIVKTIKAYVVLDSIDVDEVRDELSGLLPSYMMPKSIVKIDKLPINSNGKIDRKKLSEL